VLLRELVLHDFRTYGGRQTFNLLPERENRPIILVGGLNGAGKTTLLDSLQLVLYGQRAKCASRGDLAYKEYLRQAIHRHAAPSAGAAIELNFSHASEGKEQEYRVRRTWYATPSGLRERVEVEVDGSLDPVLTEQWDERVDDFAPHRISHLFFFDGEKIASLAEEESAAAVLKTAVHSLLGLDLVDRLVGDLGILDQKKRREGKTSFDRSKAEQLEAERERLMRELQAARGELGALVRQQDAARSALEKAQEVYRGEGGELAEQRIMLETQRTTLEVTRQERRDRLRDLTLGCLPLFAVSHLLTEVDDQAHAEGEARNHSMIAGVLEHRDEQILSRLKEADVVTPAFDQFERLLREDRCARDAHKSDPGYLDLDPEEVRELDRLVKAELPSNVEQAKSLCQELDTLAEQALVLDRKLKSIPEEGALADLRDRLHEAGGQVESLRALQGAQEERIRVLDSQLLATNESYRRELEKELAATQSNEGLHRKLQRIGVASDVLDRFRARILERNLGRLEDAILESFRELIRKPNLVSKLTIDPRDFSLDLIGGDGQRLPRRDLSAGESQLLAVAMLWGLARTAGLPQPVVIDTPLGRLDSKHRASLVGRYFPKASHQVLLLSTDEEIKENRLTELEPFIGRSYLLEHDPEEDRTLVSEGYFQN